MRRSAFKEPKPVLAFNDTKVFIAIFRSCQTCSELMQINSQGISHCCVGKQGTSGGHYFRYLHEDVEVTKEDLGTLKLSEYDSLIGFKPPVYSHKRESMKRKPPFSKHKTNSKAEAVMLFNGAQVFIGMICSCQTCAKIMQINLQGVSHCCNAKQIACAGYYFRYLDNRVELQREDYGTLKLKDYDKLIGFNAPGYLNLQQMCKKRKLHFEKCKVKRKNKNNENPEK